MPSRDADSALTGVAHVADGGGACGVYGEKAGVIGDSGGYDLQAEFKSPGLGEFGVVSGDIQFVILACP